jgi:hypothetical protein
MVPFANVRPSSCLKQTLEPSSPTEFGEEPYLFTISLESIMKCPKCGYISFDYNDSCPKCNKDISAEREKMNLPSYAPNPPSLLGALTGEGGEPEFDLKIESAESMESSIEQEISLSPEDSQAIEAMEEAFKDSQELEIELDTGHEDKEEKPREEVELSGLAPEITDAAIPDEDRPSDLVEPSPEDSDIDLLAEVKAGGEMVGFEKEISLEDSDIGLPDEVRAGGEEIAPEKDISLEDSETGLPQVKKEARDAADLKKTSVFDPLKVDEESDSFDLKDLSGAKSGKSIETEFSLGEKEEALLDLEELDTILDDSVEAAETSDSTPDKKKEENFSLDLESLELDLDLDTPEDKSS